MDLPLNFYESRHIKSLPIGQVGTGTVWYWCLGYNRENLVIECVKHFKLIPTTLVIYSTFFLLYTRQFFTL